MGSILKNLFGIVYASEQRGIITLGGMKVGVLLMDIRNTWSTSKIERSMFVKFDRREISFPDFFAPDVHYMLQTLLESPTTRSSHSVIRKAMQVLEEDTWLSNIGREFPTLLNRDKLKQFKYRPLPHQDEFFNIYDQRTQQYGLNGYLLSAAAGSGKTLTNLMLAEMVEANLVVIVAPKNAVYTVWSQHLKEMYDKPQDHWIVADGKPYEGQKYVVSHYETLDKVLLMARLHFKDRAVVILDESHNMNEIKSLRTTQFIDLCAILQSKHVIWSSGTPLKAMGYESIPLLRTIDPLFTPNVEERFRAVFGRNATRALDVLRNRMGMISYRVEKSTVVDNKPTGYTLNIKLKNGNDYTLETVRQEMGDFIRKRIAYYKENQAKYREIFDQALDIHRKQLRLPPEFDEYETYHHYLHTILSGYEPSLMQEEARFCNYYELKKVMPSIPQPMRAAYKDCRSVVKYPELKVMGEALGGILGRKRVQCHIDMAKQLDLNTIIEKTEKKVVVFTSYVEVVKTLDGVLRKDKHEPVLVYGDTNKDLAALVKKFGTDPDANPMVATFQSMSTAVPLIMANAAVFTNVPFRDHELTQAKARIDRLGQDTPVHYYFVMLDTGNEPNVSTRAKDILEWSRQQIEAILGKSYSGEMAEAVEESSDASSGFTQMNMFALEYYQD